MSVEGTGGGGGGGVWQDEREDEISSSRSILGSFIVQFAHDGLLEGASLTWSRLSEMEGCSDQSWKKRRNEVGEEGEEKVKVERYGQCEKEKLR